MVQFALVLVVSIARFVSINYNFEIYDIFYFTSIAKRKTIGCNYFATRWKKSWGKKIPARCAKRNYWYPTERAINCYRLSRKPLLHENNQDGNLIRWFLEVRFATIDKDTLAKIRKLIVIMTVPIQCLIKVNVFLEYRKLLVRVVTSYLSLHSSSIDKGIHIRATCSVMYVHCTFDDFRQLAISYERCSVSWSCHVQAWLSWGREGNSYVMDSVGERSPPWRWVFPVSIVVTAQLT